MAEMKSVKLREIEMDEAMYRVLEYTDKFGGHDIPHFEIHKEVQQIEEYGDAESGPRARVVAIGYQLVAQGVGYLSIDWDNPKTVERDFRHFMSYDDSND
jgi:hypothetical protein